jgi:hypothetical protein
MVGEARAPGCRRGLSRAAGSGIAGGALLAMLACGLAAPGVAAAGGRSVVLRSGTVTLRFTGKAFAALTRSTTGSVVQTRTVTPLAPAVPTSTGVFKFPLTRGKLNVQTLTGQAASMGGLSFANTSTSPVLGTTTRSFALRSFALHFGGALPVLAATFVGASTSPNVPLAALGTRHVKHAKHGRMVTISGVSLKLTSTGVQALDGQNSVFKVGQTIGTISVSAKT